MPLLHGKQIQNTSVNLNKLTGTGSLILQTGATFQVPTANITTALDVVNKYYVDSLAAGLNPHAAVKTATTGNLNLSTATSSPFISGVTVSTNDRILVWQQSNNFFNGIYVYNGSTFSRATDMDGNPSQEVSVGDYTFVISGSYSGNGYVVISSGTYSGVLEPIDGSPITWSQFTGPSSFLWGNGLVNNANTISVNMASGSGLTFSGTGLTINSAIAGNGLSWTTGVLSVNTANGLQITSDNVEISPSVAGTGLSFSSGVINIKNTAVTANSYGDADTVPTITFNAQGQAIAATAVSISITSGQVNNFTASVQSIASASASNGLSVSGNGVILGGILLKNTTIDVDNYNFDIDNVSTLTIDSSTASIHGQNEINLYSGNGGFSASYFTLRPDVLIVEVDDGFGGGAQLWVESPNVQVPYAVSDGASASMKIVDDFYQKGLVYVADYTANFTENSLVTKQYVDDRIAASSSQVSAGVGITISNVGKISLSALGATTSLGSVNTVNTFTYNNYGQITTSATVSIAIPSGQVTNFTASVNTLINSATAGSPVYSQRNITPTNTTGNLASTSIILANTPNDGAQVMVYVNGQLQYLGDGTSSNVDCFFGSTSSVAKSISDLTSGDQLYWNGTYVGFDLSTTDKVDIIYNV